MKMASTTKGNRTQQIERFCKYIHRYCNQTRLDGYDYCIRHILEDKSAPFKQCMYVNQPNKKRCTNAAPKSDKNEKRDTILCPFHAKRAMLKVKITAPKKKAVEGPASFLKYLEHYCKDPNHDPTHKREIGNIDRADVPVTEGGGPTNLNELESSFEDMETVENRARVDSVDDDFCWVEKYGECLDNAGVYTHKEILTIAQEKILRLQQLYCEELKVVYRQLRESRRSFLAELNKQTKGSVSTSEAAQPLSHEMDKNSLQALTHYHRRSGSERVLRHRVQMQRLNGGKPAPAKQQCTYEDLGIKCTRDAIVLTQFCKMHILFDPKQLLFKHCPMGDKIKCKNPVLKFEEGSTCDFHLHRLLKSKLKKPSQPSQSPETVTKTFSLEPEPFQSMDDIVSLGLDAITPGSMFGLDQFGEPGESTDTVRSEDQSDLLQIQPISLNPPADILSDSRKSECEE